MDRSLRLLVTAGVLCAGSFRASAQTAERSIAGPSQAVGQAPEPLDAVTEAGHWKQARARVDELAQVHPNDANTAYRFSQVKQAFGDLDGALKLAERAVALDGNNARYHYQLAQVCGDLSKKAGLFGEISLARRFRKEAEKAAALDPKYVEVRYWLVDFYLDAPGLIGGSKAKGQAMADEIVRMDPERGYLAQALIAHNAKDAAREEAYFRKALEANPKSYEALISLASFYMSGSMRKHDLAEKRAREALALDPRRVGAYEVLARVYATDQRWSELETTLGQAERNVSDDLNPFYEAGKTLQSGDIDLAREERYFRKYLTQDAEGESPSLAVAHKCLGVVLEKQGRRAEAIAELEAALRLQPDFLDAKKELKRLK